MVVAMPRPSPMPRVKPWAAAAAARAEAAAARAAAPSAKAPRAAPKYGPGEWLETKSLRRPYFGEDAVRVAGVRVDPRQSGGYIYIVQDLPSYETREPRRFPPRFSTYELREAKLKPLMVALAPPVPGALPLPTRMNDTVGATTHGSSNQWGHTT